MVAFYGLYTLVRDVQGSASVSAGRALRNARGLIRWERLLGLFHEQAVQATFIQARGFMRFWNVYYGSAHFAVTGVALVWLFRRMPHRYRFWRTVLAATTATALAGYALFPLLPPRLLPASYGFVDSLRAFGGLWSFDSGSVARLSNQYAAMPSLHVAWALWSAAVLLPAMRSPVTRAVVLVYPAMTLFAIIVTANHYFLDAVAGAITLLVGYLLAMLFTSRPRRALPPPDDLEATGSSERVFHITETRLPRTTPGRDARP